MPDMTLPSLLQGRPSATIQSLAEHPRLAPLVARWIWEAFWQEEGASLAEAEAFTVEALTRQGLPQTFVLFLDGTPAGTASLVENDLQNRAELSPWLASVWVEPWARGQGHAGALVRAAETAAQALGVGTLWLYTRRAERIYRRAGWTVVEYLTHLGGTAALMRRNLQPCAPDGEQQ